MDTTSYDRHLKITSLEVTLNILLWTLFRLIMTSFKIQLNKHIYLIIQNFTKIVKHEDDLFLLHQNGVIYLLGPLKEIVQIFGS